MIVKPERAHGMQPSWLIFGCRQLILDTRFHNAPAGHVSGRCADEQLPVTHVFAPQCGSLTEAESAVAENLGQRLEALGRHGSSNLRGRLRSRKYRADKLMSLRDTTSRDCGAAL
jgi:hypothetical protein